MANATTHETRNTDAKTSSPEFPGGDAASTPWPWIKLTGIKLLQAILFGLAFGFLLQKGGVAKFDILIGVLLLEDFVVVKVMLSAIVVGMIGVYISERAGILEPQIKETAYGSNIIGGIIFGVGFGLIAYCPGTNASAVGQGNLDALVGIVGMVLGAYLFALATKFAGGDLSKWGASGKITFSNVLGLPRAAVVSMTAILLVGVLVLLHIYFP